MNNFLAKTAAGLLNTVIITVCVKVIYNELPEGTKANLEKKAVRVYGAVKESLKDMKTVQ